MNYISITNKQTKKPRVQCKRLQAGKIESNYACLEKEMATHSSVPAWRIPGMVEPGRLPSMGLTEPDTTEAT